MECFSLKSFLSLLFYLSLSFRRIVLRCQRQFTVIDNFIIIMISFPYSRVEESVLINEIRLGWPSAFHLRLALVLTEVKPR